MAQRRRTLLVARTGFGKSAVYFSATKMLRDRGWGPTVVVSPLLALMRDQVDAASRLGLNAVTINSSNVDAWDELEAQIHRDEVDLLLIAPERLANAGFRARVFSTLLETPFALVCDEAHCISDWGHDFRPDYRRLRRLLDELPSWTPVLATTATANQRVTDDVAAQLGDDTLVLRTPLDRSSLHISLVDLPDDGHRLAWLGSVLPELAGSGIVYCLTVDQAERTAAWLRQQGHAVAAYTGAVDAEDRLRLERALRANEMKALVATSALGMGFDKGDLAFCVHLGLPPSAVAYYQQIGRAGRAIDRAEVIALPRPVEDAAVWRWFESVSLPSREICEATLASLHTVEPTPITELEHHVNLGRTRLTTLLNILDVDGAVERVGRGWIRTAQPWTYDAQLATALRELRRSEADEMLTWAADATCRLRFLREALDDDEAVDCGRCDRCSRVDWHRDLDPTTVAQATELLRGTDHLIEPRKQWPSGLEAPTGRIPPNAQLRPGRALARVGDGGWDSVVTALIEQVEHTGAVELSDDLVRSVAAVLKRWDWEQRPGWICPMPSRRRAPLVNALADALGALGKLPVLHALVMTEPTEMPRGLQADQANSVHQVQNTWPYLRVAGRVEIDPSLAAQPVLLIDDEADSRWTLTAAAARLAEADLGPVLPFTLRSR